MLFLLPEHFSFQLLTDPAASVELSFRSNITSKGAFPDP